MSDDLFKTPLPDIDGKSILITGGTGSFGSALVKTLFRDYNPRRIAIYSRGEHEHYDMQMALEPEQRRIFRSFIGDVRDRARLTIAMQRVDIVIHAAALKHVPIAEYNPFECVHTNVIGAENVVHAAVSAGVERVIALSTDKAVNPINLYGASKLAADKIFVAGNSFGYATDTYFSVVRYGNVVGSKGSVIPYFRKLVAEGAADLPITDERMTRFWITLDQAVAFTLSSLQLMRGGEIFVPKIPSMKMTDLAEAIAPGLPQKIVGIRPGEKLHEVMIDQYSARSTVDIGDRYVIEPEWGFWPRTPFAEEGHPKVTPCFEYSSDVNDDWLTGEALRDMVAAL